MRVSNNELGRKKESNVRQKTIWFSVVIVVTLISIACICNIFTDYDYDQPDTAANREGFAQHFGFPALASVSDLYFYADELGADVTFQFGFVTDQETTSHLTV